MNKLEELGFKLDISEERMIYGKLIIHKFTNNAGYGTRFKIYTNANFIVLVNTINESVHLNFDELQALYEYVRTLK